MLVSFVIVSFVPAPVCILIMCPSVCLYVYDLYAHVYLCMATCIQYCVRVRCQCTPAVTYLE